MEYPLFNIVRGLIWIGSIGVNSKNDKAALRGSVFAKLRRGTRNRPTKNDFPQAVEPLRPRSAGYLKRNISLVICEKTYLKVQQFDSAHKMKMLI